MQKLGARAKYNFWETPQGNLYNFPSAAGRGSGTERDMAMKIWSIIQFSKFSRGGCSSVPSSSFPRSLERGGREDFEIYAQEEEEEGEELKVSQGRGGGRQKSVPPSFEVWESTNISQNYSFLCSCQARKRLISNNYFENIFAYLWEIQDFENIPGITVGNSRRKRRRKRRRRKKESFPRWMHRSPRRKKLFLFLEYGKTKDAEAYFWHTSVFGRCMQSTGYCGVHSIPSGKCDIPKLGHDISGSVPGIVYG